MLAIESDPGEAIFEDVKRLYALRSTLVHGGVLKASKLRTTVASISTVPAQTQSASFADALGHAVDRLRDLVRRSILAELGAASAAERAPGALGFFSGARRR